MMSSRFDLSCPTLADGFVRKHFFQEDLLPTISHMVGFDEVHACLLADLFSISTRYSFFLKPLLNRPDRLKGCAFTLKYNRLGMALGVASPCNGRCTCKCPCTHLAPASTRSICRRSLRGSQQMRQQRRGAPQMPSEFSKSHAGLLNGKDGLCPVKIANVGPPELEIGDRRIDIAQGLGLTRTRCSSRNAIKAFNS
jgi:hypothetical protein